MTHNELLTKINNYTCCSGAHELALKAVVELHKPVEGKFGLSCLKCRDYENYPCSTIQAIEKELV
jgi:hypothetical protein